MTGPIAVDTPDYQRGVVSAQMLLATVPGTIRTVTVGVPPNAETLVVSVPNLSTATVPSVFGLTSGQRYAGAAVAQTTGVLASPTWFFDVSSVTDDQVQVEFPALLDETWYVYADAAAHVVADLSKLVNQAGQQYVIPSVPSTISGDHPPNELQFASNILSASGILVAAPGAGQRLRLFGGWMATTVSGLTGYLEDVSAGKAVAGCAGPGNMPINIPLTGLPFATNSALKYVLNSGTGAMLMGAWYTTEAV